MTFTCTVTSTTHIWIITDGSGEQEIGSVNPGSPTETNLGFELQVVDVTAVPITSTATVNTTVDLNNTVIVCRNELIPPNLIEQNITVSIIGEFFLFTDNTGYSIPIACANTKGYGNKINYNNGLI